MHSDADRARYEGWVRNHAPELYRYAHRLAGSHQGAEDLVQETFTEAWRNVSSQHSVATERAWLFQILRFRFARLLEREKQSGKRLQTLSEHTVAEMTGLDPGLERLSNRDWLDRGLAALSPELRRTFLMVFSEELTCRQTAEQLAVPLGTVLSRLDSARRTLRETMHRSLERAGLKAQPTSHPSSAIGAQTLKELPGLPRKGVSSR